MGGGGSKPVPEKPLDRQPPPQPSTTPARVQQPPASTPLQNDAPIPLTAEQQTAAVSSSSNSIIRPEDIIGTEGSTARYIRIKTIGQGAYGEASIVQCNPNYTANLHPAVAMQYNSLVRPVFPGMYYVAKINDLRQLRLQYRQYAQTEFTCLAHSNHFAIIKYYEHFTLDENSDQTVLITEFANHGDLHHNLLSSETPGASPLRLTEREAGTYFIQILCALNHVHRRRMIHRDVKSANLFLTSNGIIKLGDFGFSQKYESTVSSESVAGTFLGTPYYLSPEMWKGMRYGKRADVWAAGVVLYEMLMDGQRPFDATGLGELREKVLEHEVFLPTSPPAVNGLVRGPFTAEMRSLVKSIFNRNPRERPGTEELIATPVMQHYLCLFEKHIHQLIASDNLLVQQNPNVDIRTRLNFPDESERALVLQGLQDAKEVVVDAANKEKDPLAFEGVVYKDSQNGVWKERYLTLTEETLVISLSKGKSAAVGSERSKSVPVHLILSTSPCTFAQPSAPTNSFVPVHGFAIAMKSMHTIVFGVRTAEERDQWLTAMIRVLQID